MNYVIHWFPDHVVVKYSDVVTNIDIQYAHFTLNGDDRFYRCKGLVLDLLNADISGVDVNELYWVVGTDLGASGFLPNLKVAMLITNPVAVKIAQQYIDQNLRLDSPWDFKILPTLEDAKKWFL